MTGQPTKKSAAKHPAPVKTSAGKKAEFGRVQFMDAAIADLHDIKKRALPVLREVFAALKRLDQGELRPTPLKDFGKTGDLSDCGKIVVETDGHPEYRIVGRDLGSTFEISEVVTVEERAEDLAYLLAGVRLGRITDPIRRSDTERKIARIRKLRANS